MKVEVAVLGFPSLIVLISDPGRKATVRPRTLQKLWSVDAVFRAQGLCERKSRWPSWAYRPYYVLSLWT